MKINRRSALLGGLGTALAGSQAFAQEVKFFRIGTGGTAGTYFPIGGLIANAISNPPGSRRATTAACGVPGLVATAVASNGSVANINGIRRASNRASPSPTSRTGPTPARGVYEGKPKVADLRAIANLYPESIHLVARKGANIKAVADLKGKRVSLDEPGSGTLVDARLDPRRVRHDREGRQGRVPQAATRRPTRCGTAASTRSSSSAAIRQAPSRSSPRPPASTSCRSTGPEVDKMLKQYGFFAGDTIPANTYKGVGEVKTIAVDANGSRRQAARRARSTRSPRPCGTTTRASCSTPDMRRARRSSSRRDGGLGIPFHPGAEKFYKEKGC